MSTDSTPIPAIFGNLEGQVALVTGASRGIGQAIADTLARAGATVIGTATSEKGAEAIGQRLGAPHRGVALNVNDAEACAALVDAIVAEHGKLSILVNNAGITKDGLMLRMSEAQWDAVINVNLKSAFNFTHACVPIMMRQRGGSIINMASVVGVHGNAGQANYSASKAGMIALAKSVAQEMGSRGVRANAIAPGFIETAMTAQLSEEVRKEWMKTIPLRRGGQAEDVANVAVFLASDLSSYVTGQVIQVDGGMNT